MGKTTIEFQNVSFAYESQSTSFIRKLSVTFSRGWTGLVGANGTGKSTLLKLATGMIGPVTGNVRIPDNTIYCRQRTDFAPDQFEDFLSADDHEAHMLKGRLGIDPDWIDRWETLSHGERKRAQIGTALWLQPEIMAIDEPTNHLDSEAREMLISSLKMFRGTGLIVSHDKDLLDTICQACLFIDPPDFDLKLGNFSTGWRQIQLARESKQKQHLQARKESKRLDREISKRREEAARADKKRSKRGIDKKDHDAKSKINLARLSGKDATAGKLMNQLKGRQKQSQERLDSIAVKKTYQTGIWQQGECSKRNTLFDVEAGELSLGANLKLSYPKLTMKPDDRIALTGLNGVGKSTLVQYILEKISLPGNRITIIPQEIPLERSREILKEAQQLPGDKLGQMMTFVNRLGTRPPRLLESMEPSPGEIRKILLAVGAAYSPHLIIMDEPTNHLDLISIECLKEALQEFPAGLLLISHDRNFLDSLTRTEWHIRKDEVKQNWNRLEIL
jgi:ATPase subunit of ABC transporter with duplicated ATPase domains